MSDDLKEKLRDNTRTYDDKIADRLDAADRIEELEAQLATARADALREAAEMLDTGGGIGGQLSAKRVRALIPEK